MSAKKSLMDSMKSFDTAAPVAPLEPPVPTAAQPQPTSRAPSRRDKRAITGYVSAKAFQQFQILRAEHGRDVQQLVEEALNDLFRKYGKPPIA
jgi:hypothetical protein